LRWGKQSQEKCSCGFPSGFAIKKNPPRTAFAALTGSGWAACRPARSLPLVGLIRQLGSPVRPERLATRRVTPYIARIPHAGISEGRRYRRHEDPVSHGKIRRRHSPRRLNRIK